MDTIDYLSVLADLKKRRDDLEKAIAAIELIAAQPSSGGTSAQLSNDSNVPDDAFFGMTVVDAVTKYLRIVKRKKPILDIVEALEKGGFTHQSKNFYNVVSSILSRERSQFVKVGREIGLPEWYGGAKKQKAPKKSSARDESPESDDSGTKQALASSNGRLLLT